jgi:hypothetical protein
MYSALECAYVLKEFFTHAIILDYMILYFPSGAHNSGYGKWHSRGTRRFSWATLSPGVINTET